MKRIAWVVFAWFALVTSVQAASFDCAKASTKIERMICGDDNASRTDEGVELSYLRALERTDDRQKLVLEQREWLKKVRNACTNADCLYKAHLIRAEALDAIPTHKCYWLEPPKKNETGKRASIEPICHVMEENLNQFCDQPPMACGLKIAPQFSQQFTLPGWTPIDPEANRTLIEEFLRAPYEGFRKQDADAVCAEEQPKLKTAFANKRITFSQARLDLYNLGKVQTVYRLDYGNCQADNPQLKNPSQWGWAIRYAKIRTQYSPDIIRPLFQQYFPMDDGYFNEVFLYEGKAYDYILGGPVNPETGLGENQMVVNRHEQKTYKGDKRPVLLINNICIFNYQPTQQGSE